MWFPQLTLSHRPGTPATLDWLSPTLNTKQVNNNKVIIDKILLSTIKSLYYELLVQCNGIAFTILCDTSSQTNCDKIKSICHNEACDLCINEMFTTHCSHIGRMVKAIRPHNHLIQDTPLTSYPDKTYQHSIAPIVLLLSKVLLVAFI